MVDCSVQAAKYEGAKAVAAAAAGTTTTVAANIIHTVYTR